MASEEKDEQKLGWGGKRDNQNGRPKLPKDQKREFLTARVKPDTKKWLLSQEGGAGKTIDRLVHQAKSKK